MKRTLQSYIPTIRKFSPLLIALSIDQWARMDSNHRTPKRTDLQSVAVGYLANQSHLSESNQRPTDYKSVALPAELKWHFLNSCLCQQIFLATDDFPPTKNFTKHTLSLNF